jgi:hypothetical protein
MCNTFDGKIEVAPGRLEAELKDMAEVIFTVLAIVIGFGICVMLLARYCARKAKDRWPD